MRSHTTFAVVNIMNNFTLFFPLGIGHIVSLSALDHILFITALCLRYQWRDWKKLLVLVTAFTIGHSLTLTLSTLNIINLPTALTEFFIAVTILFTSINNLYMRSFQFNQKYPLIYFYAMVFGLIHGLGFSTLLKNMLGKNENIIGQLLSFNLGIEAGQLFIVAIILLLSFIFGVLKFNRRDYVVFVSGGIAALAIEMMIERFPV